MKKTQAARKRRANAPWIAIRHLATALALREQTLREQAAPRREGPARFIQCWAAPAGNGSIPHALDEDGQVWRCNTVQNQTTKEITEQYWTRLGMERRNT